MDKYDFDNKIIDIRKQAPILFELEHDKLATVEDVVSVENYYSLKLPKSYIDFVKEYGGGYFGTTLILSCDSNSDFYIINNIGKDFVKEKNILPVVDFQTGDYMAFVIENGICQERLVIYSHEDPMLRVYKSSFYDAIIEDGFGHLF